MNHEREKRMAKIDREIEVVETIIGQLENCLEIYANLEMYNEFRITLQDIQKCKIELKKLILQQSRH